MTSAVLRQAWKEVRSYRHLISLHGPRRRLKPHWYLAGTHRSRSLGLAIGGASRSGTTLIRVILDSHPDLACGPESKLLCGVVEESALIRNFGVTRRELRRMERQENSYPEFVARMLSEYAARMGATYWAEKTPGNVLNIGWILDRFPNLTFLHVVRDGRAVVNSLRTHPRFRVQRGRTIPTGRVNSLDSCIARWRMMVEAGLAFDNHPRVLRVAYEDVLIDPRRFLTPVLRQLGLEWHEQMEKHHAVQAPTRDVQNLAVSRNALDPIDPAMAVRWRRELDADQVARIEGEGGHILDRLGYAREAAH